VANRASGRDHSREVVILRTGVVFNTERHPDGGVTRVWLSQNRDLSVGQIVEDGAQRDHDVRFLCEKSCVG
jgi:hypothetical protein